MWYIVYCNVVGLHGVLGTVNIFWYWLLSWCRFTCRGRDYNYKYNTMILSVVGLHGEGGASLGGWPGHWGQTVLVPQLLPRNLLCHMTMSHDWVTWPCNLFISVLCTCGCGCYWNMDDSRWQGNNQHVKERQFLWILFLLIKFLFTFSIICLSYLIWKICIHLITCFTEKTPKLCINKFIL